MHIVGFAAAGRLKVLLAHGTGQRAAADKIEKLGMGSMLESCQRQIMVAHANFLEAEGALKKRLEVMRLCLWCWQLSSYRLPNR